MTVIDDLTSYYSSLLIKQYFGLTKAKATVELIARGACCDMVFTAVRDAYDLETAEGLQLDVLGKYIGANRFALNGALIDDGSYRIALKMKIIKNNCNHSLKSIDDLFYQYFPGRVVITDNEDMTMTYEYGIADEELMQALLEQRVLPQPSAVTILLTATMNPNGEFGYSSNGVADSFVNGYGSTEDEAIVDEAQTSTTTTKVTVMYLPLSVTGVWLASDPGHAGTNYYTGGSFTGLDLTLGTPLPGATTAVLVNYDALHGGSFLQMGS